LCRLQAVGDGTGVKPVYDSLIEVKDLPYLDPDPEPLMRHITAAEAAGRPPVTFQRVERVAVLLSVLQSTRHNGFPVTATGADGEPYILGVVLRSQLLVLLQTKRCFQPSPFVSEVRGWRGVVGSGKPGGWKEGVEAGGQVLVCHGMTVTVAGMHTPTHDACLVVCLLALRSRTPSLRYHLTPFPQHLSHPCPHPPQLSARVAFSYEQSEFLSPISEPPPDAFELSLSAQQQDMYIDLGPYVNPSYYVVQEDASLSKVYTLFRTLGLRHLCVIPR
jgi:hypothetical protein